MKGQFLVQFALVLVAASVVMMYVAAPVVSIAPVA